MLDEDSTRFLVCKKIAQLVKLINHLGSQIADKNHAKDFLLSQFEENLNSLIKKQKDYFNNTNELIKQIEEESEISYKSKYKDNHEQIYLEYEKTLVNCQTDLTETTVLITRELSKITSYINSIDSDLELQLKQLDEDINQSKKQYSDKIEKLSQSYKSEIDLLDDESEEKLNLLQEQTSRKLDTLDRDFNRSLNDLKSKFGQINSSSQAQIENETILRKFQDDHDSLKEYITATKDEITFLLSNAKAVLKEQIHQKDKISESLREMTKNQNDELNEKQRSIEQNLQLLDEESQKIKNEFENSQKEMNQKLEDLQKSFVNLTKSDLDEIQEQQLLFQLSSKKSSESTNTTIDDINKQIAEKEASLKQKQNESENLFNKLNTDTQNLLNQIQAKNEELLKNKETHESEQKILSSSQKSAINDLISIHQKEIEKLKEKIYQKSEKDEINKQIEENRNIFNSLCFEKAQLCCENKDFEDPEISETQSKYDNELKKLESELQSELENVINEEKLLIDACSESHRNELFQINTDIAKKYDEHLESIKEAFNNRDFKEEDEQIDLEYEQKLRELEKQYEQLEKIETVQPMEDDLKEKEEIEFLLKEKNDKNEKIQSEKKLIIDEFLKQQKIEEGEYLQKMAEINYNSNLKQKNHSDEIEEIKNKHYPINQKLDLQIKQKEEELNSLKGTIVFVDKVKTDFDNNEKKLRDSLAELRAKSDIQISKAIHEAESQKREVINKMENFQMKCKKIAAVTKQRTEQSTFTIKDATEKTQEESKKLQQRVAHAISKVVKHFTKEKEKMNKKFTQKSDELKKLIEEQKSETNQFVSESLKKEEETRTTYENDVQSNESDLKQKLDLIKDEGNKKAEELDDQYNQILNKINQFKLDILDQKSRDEELLIIERLELQLAIKEKHIQDITEDISDCKNKIVKQEDVYNSHFGNQPAIAVFRPTTGIVPIPINLRLKQQQRPASAAVKMRSMAPFLKNKSKKNDIR